MTRARVLRHVRLSALGLLLALGGRAAAAASHGGAPPERARVVAERSLPAMRGDHLHETLVEVTYAPGGSSAPHVHRCPVIGHVIAGAIRTRAAGGAERIVHAGETFEEDADQPHLVSANASDREPATLLAFFLCDRDGPRSVALVREIAR